jgi:hypothetical protein
MLNFLSKIKQYLVTILTIIFVIAIFAGIVAIVMYLRKSDKKLQIVPEFKIIDAKVDPNLDALTDSVNIARDILSKVQK